MHEVSIAENILDIALTAAKTNTFSKISKISLKVGSLTSIMSESLVFAFKAVSENTIARDSELEIDLVQAKGQCDNCQTVFDIDYLNKLCPKCSTFCTNVLTGYELYVNTIEGV